MSLDIRNFTRAAIPRFPYEKALEAVLPGWEISLVFAGETRAQALNKQLRGKDYVPNVLSYETGNKSGEIIICPRIARKQATAYDMSFPTFVGYLFIHGCFHLKGEQHGATMERKERALLERINRSLSKPARSSHVPTNRNRH